MGVINPPQSNMNRLMIRPPRGAHGSLPMNRAGVCPSRAQKGSLKSKAPVDWVRAGRMRLAVAETCLPPACAPRAGKCRHRQAATLRPNGGSWAVSKSKQNRKLSLRELRAGVRGNRSNLHPTSEISPGTVELGESPGRTEGFPGRMKIPVR